MLIAILVGSSVLAAAAMTYLLLSSASTGHLWQKYRSHVEQQLNLLMLPHNSGRWCAWHLLALLALVLVAVILESWALLFALPVAALVPSFLLHRMLVARREALGEQLATWLTILSNNLQSASNITDAIASSASLVGAPLRDELERMVGEIHYGESLEQALQKSGRRLESPLYTSVLTTLLVARKSGGNLPEILEKSADVLREMDRLEGVVRTKTAEGKSQSFVLAMLPFVVVGALQKVDPTMLSTLAGEPLGRGLLGASFLLWLGALLVARRIVKVEI